MTRCFVIADTHFGHKNIVQFKDSSGEIIRKFNTVEEHDEYLVKQWNSVVQKQDRVYHLGDVVINRRALEILEQLNGRLCLIKGNHDIFKLKDYTKYFDDIRAYKVLPKNGIIMSHIPIHPQCMERWCLNIHGHLHQNKVIDSKYMCVSMEHLDDYKPMDLQLIIDSINETSHTTNK